MIRFDEVEAGVDGLVANIESQLGSEKRAILSDQVGVEGHVRDGILQPHYIYIVQQHVEPQWQQHQH